MIASKFAAAVFSPFERGVGVREKMDSPVKPWNDVNGRARNPKAKTVINQPRDIFTVPIAGTAVNPTIDILTVPIAGTAVNPTIDILTVPKGFIVA
jgi:hypothetical protein